MNNTVVNTQNAFTPAPMLGSEKSANLPLPQAVSGSASGAMSEASPWHRPKTVRQAEESESYRLLKQRLATLPTRSKHSRQALYIDLWTGQYWLGLMLSGPAPAELLNPVSTDTALSIAQGACSGTRAMG